MADENNISNISTDPIQDQIIEIVRTIPLFVDLDDKEKNAIAKLFELKKYALGDPISKKGDVVENFYYVYSGSVRRKTHLNGMLQSLGKYNKNEFFGELSFLDDLTWQFDIASADPDLRLLVLNTKDETLAKIIEKLKARIAHSQISKMLEEILGGSTLDHSFFVELTDNIFVEEITSGEKLFKQGEHNNSLYLILSGIVELYREDLKERNLVGVASKNDFIGEYGAITGRAQGYDAVVTNDATIIEIPHQYLLTIFQHNSFFQEQLNKKIKDLESDISKKKGESGEEDKSIYPEFVETGESRIRRFPWLHQHDESDCGAACLTMIAKYNGLSLRMGQVREMANVSIEGATMGAVCRAAENLGFRARPYKLSYSGLKDINLPAIIHWQGYHWVVLFRRNEKYVWLADPALGIRKLTHDEFKESWTRYAIELEPTDKLQDLEPAKSPVLRFAKYLLPYKFFFFEIFIGSLILNILGLASPLFIQSIIDNVIVYKNISLLNMMLMGMVMVTFFSTLTSSIQQLVMIYVTTRLDLKLLADFYKHVLSLPMKFFYSRKTGDIITRFGENSKVRAILSGSAISTVLNVIMVVVYLSMMFAYSSSLSFVVMAFMPFFIGLTLIFTPIIKRISIDIFKSNSEQSSIMIESIQGIETIKANSVEWNVRTKWEDQYVENVNLSAKMQKTQMFAGILSQTISTTSSITLLWFGAHEVIEGNMSMGEFMGFNAIVGSVMGPIMGLISLYDQFQNVSTSMDRLNDVLEMKPEEDPPAKNEKPKIFMQMSKGEISFQNVSFRYGSEDSPLVINNLNLEVKSGQTIAFVGKSGCGKSTLIKMIAGFNIPTSGKLSVDGIDIKNIDIYSLRKNIGWVLQDSFLFSGTVAENIALGYTNPDMDKVIKAAKMGAADEFIVDFPMSYKTMVGEKGMAVSGGQRQRICIARALYRNPAIILMDEATSSLDAQSEKRIQENLDNLLIGRTAVIIAHRLSTVRNADMICYLDKGHIVEKGTHDVLMQQRGLYYAMASEQLGSD
jgi:ATP-binding cassette, subfamily B, bacterial HlyB/CyaB